MPPSGPDDDERRENPGWVFPDGFARWCDDHGWACVILLGAALVLALALLADEVDRSFRHWSPYNGGSGYGAPGPHDSALDYDYGYDDNR